MQSQLEAALLGHGSSISVNVAEDEDRDFLEEEGDDDEFDEVEGFLSLVRCLVWL